MTAMSIVRIAKLLLSLVPRPSLWYTHVREEGLVNVVHNCIEVACWASVIGSRSVKVR